MFGVVSGDEGMGEFVPGEIEPEPTDESVNDETKDEQEDKEQ